MDAVTKKQQTVGEIAIRSKRLAIQLQSLGCQSDSVVGMISENRSEYFPIILASIYAGTIATCFSPSYTTGKYPQPLDIEKADFVLETQRFPTLVHKVYAIQ